jgi:hypothetical protein
VARHRVDRFLDGVRVLDDDPAAALLVGADVDELGQQLLLVRADHAERTVSGVDQLHSGAHDTVQRALELQSGPDRDHRVEQALEPVPRLRGLGQPRLEREQAVQRPPVRLYPVRLVPTSG